MAESVGFVAGELGATPAHSQNKMAEAMNSAFMSSPDYDHTAMDLKVLSDAIATVPAGRWAVGVSGGADSVALLLRLSDRPDLSLHIAHMDHQTRAGESGRDAAFVADLSAQLGLPCTIGVRSDIEASTPVVPRNTSSRFRHARFGFFGQLTLAQKLQGVILAHHAGDQAETVLLRILRGAGPSGLIGMQMMSHVRGLCICRPLLKVPSHCLRKYLLARGQAWREDSSNLSHRYQRNRLRKWLKDEPVSSPLNETVGERARCSADAPQACTSKTDLMRCFTQLSPASESVRDWLDRTAPVLGDVFQTVVLQGLPILLAKHAASRWLVARGAPPSAVNNRTCERLVEMAIDAASPSRQSFPGNIDVRRRSGAIFADFDGGLSTR
jgi:tRNA(Ile)-lysidine synthetase-like protein